jgi:hypothetical protein
MSATNGSAIPQEASEIADKGKGKSVETAPSHDMMEDSEESEEESGVEDVSRLACFVLTPPRTSKTELITLSHRSQSVSANPYLPLPFTPVIPSKQLTRTSGGRR